MPWSRRGNDSALSFLVDWALVPELAVQPGTLDPGSGFHRPARRNPHVTDTAFDENKVEFAKKPAALKSRINLDRAVSQSLAMYPAAESIGLIDG